jgi:type II secretory pathway pseudopilin PulG
MRYSKGKSSGFSLLELAIVIFIILVVAAFLAPLLAGLADVDRSNDAFQDARRVYLGIVGDPKTGSLGYLGDVGTNPSSLIDLIQDPGVPGWNGPYVTGVQLDNNVVLDSFGGPLEYFYQGSSSAVTDLLAIISKGPDRASSNLSATPNQWATYSGAPSPTSINYPVDTYSKDNLVFPRFTDRIGLLSYQSAGRINVNVQSYDPNPNVLGFVSACPNLYSVKVASVPRPSDSFVVPYNPGGASFDLIQGMYHVQLLNSTSGGVYWDQAVKVAPGTSQNLTIAAPGVNSTATQILALAVTNGLASNVSMFNSNGAYFAVTTSGQTGSFSFRECNQVTIRHFQTSGGVVDSFTMPAGANYTRVLHPTTGNYVVTNNSGLYKHLFVTINHLLVGQVSSVGNRKSKTFRSTKTGEVLRVYDQNGVLRVTVTLPGTGSTTL